MLVQEIAENSMDRAYNKQVSFTKNVFKNAIGKCIAVGVY